MQHVWAPHPAGHVSPVDAVERTIKDAARLYYRLILLTGPPGSGKTRLLVTLAERTGRPLVRVGAALGELLLPLAERQRALQAQRLLAGLIDATAEQVVLLDNLELLFHASLKLDPLRCLQASARNRTIVAAWPGRLDGAELVYAAPDHAEYKQYESSNLLIIPLGQA